MVMRVKNTNLSNVAQADILVDVYFRFYDANAGGVRVTSYEITIPPSRKVVGFEFYEVGQTNYSSIVIDLVGAEIKEFGSAGVLFIEVISIDLASVLI
jgi:trehalose/maltose hydrolase-like predicted phosphorylase